MFKIGLYFALSLFAFSSVKAQNQQVIDSLMDEVKSSKSEKQKINLHLALTKEYYLKDSAKMVENANAAYKLADKINDVERKIDALEFIALLNINLGNQLQTEQLYNQIIIESEKSDFRKGIAIGFNGLGRLSTQQGIHAKALGYYFESLRISEELVDKVRMEISYQSIGNVYKEQKLYEKSLEYHFKSLEIAEELGDKADLASQYSNIGISYDLQGNYDRALEYYHRALNIGKELKDDFRIASDYNNLGMLYKAKRDYKTALNYGFRSLDVFKKIGIKPYLSYPILTIGEIYLEQPNRDSAKSFFEEGLKISEEFGIIPNIELAANSLATIEKELGNYKKAFHYHVLFKQMADSLKSDERTEQITRLDAEYKFQKERDSIQIANRTELIVLEKDIANREITQIATFLVLGLFTMLLVVLFLFLKSKMQSHKLLEVKSKELESRNNEIQQQAEEIKTLNHSLEQNLDEITRTLIFKNKKLSEYAYYNSHKTRAPIVRLLGLIQLIKLGEVDEGLAFLLQAVKDCSEELDTITIEMNRILEEAGFFEEGKINKS